MRKFSRKFFVCGTGAIAGWSSDRSMEFAYSIKNGGFFKLSRAITFLEKEKNEKDGDGYFDLRILISEDNGRSFVEMVDLEPLFIGASA